MNPLIKYLDKLHYGVAKKPGSREKTSRSKTASKKISVRIDFLGCSESWKAADLKGLKPFETQKIKGGHPLVESPTSSGVRIFMQSRHNEVMDHYGYFEPSPYALARELISAGVRRALSHQCSYLEIRYHGKNSEELLGLCVGLEMVLYKFPKIWPEPQSQLPKVTVKTSWKEGKTWIQKGQQLGFSVNLSRFLVDLPGNALNPVTYAKFLSDIFAKSKNIKCEVWDEKKLKKENMGLHIAVGQASDSPPRMVRLSYRSKACKEKPLAFVGKGITFDSGGLNIKPGGGMRLMKKDMGGSASVVGLAHWVSQTQPKINCDFYLALAENSVGAHSFRPGDILQGRNGTTVEIHNTDAEGRLVLADSIALAAETKPQAIFDLATLTGAIKYGLGGATPGLFSTSDTWSEMVMAASQLRGETAWRMPLVPSEKARLKSDVADMVNCTDGYGGAITAAHFLNAFTQKIPWVHLDMYSWVSKASGPYRHTGGSGQMVQALAALLEKL